MASALKLTQHGVLWIRNDRGSIVSVRGPESLCAVARKEVERRVEAMRTASSLYPSSAGVCTACGDAFGIEGRGGWCELCALARRVALKQMGVAL
jgi:hypothetical protein